MRPTYTSGRHDNTVRSTPGTIAPAHNTALTNATAVKPPDTSHALSRSTNRHNDTNATSAIGPTTARGRLIDIAHRSRRGPSKQANAAPTNSSDARVSVP